MLAGKTPRALLWPLLLTWSLCVSVLPGSQDQPWSSFCASLGLDGPSSAARLERLGSFLDSVESLHADPEWNQDGN